MSAPSLGSVPSVIPPSTEPLVRVVVPMGVTGAVKMHVKGWVLPELLLIVKSPPAKGSGFISNVMPISSRSPRVTPEAVQLSPLPNGLQLNPAEVSSKRPIDTPPCKTSSVKSAAREGPAASTSNATTSAARVAAEEPICISIPSSDPMGPVVGRFPRSTLLEIPFQSQKKVDQLHPYILVAWRRLFASSASPRATRGPGGGSGTAVTVGTLVNFTQWSPVRLKSTRIPMLAATAGPATGTGIPKSSAGML